MVTIKMIAKECGFSIATVSKALNGAPDISAETKETIRKVASQMGYTPNSAARMLKTSRSYNFGVLFEDQANKGLTHSFFSHILNSFKHRAEELGYDISFISDHMGGQEISYVDHARYRNCDGVVIASVDYTEHAVVDLANSGIPVVTIDCVFENCGSVLSDNVGGMTELVKYDRYLHHPRYWPGVLHFRYRLYHGAWQVCGIRQGGRGHPQSQGRVYQAPDQRRSQDS